MERRRIAGAGDGFNYLRVDLGGLVHTDELIAPTAKISIAISPNINAS
jgi:hypothetical protein